MKKLGLIVLFIATFTVSTGASELSVKSMNCELENFVGVQVGTATLEGGQVFLKSGFLANLLWVNVTTENSVSAMTKGQSWDYIFEFDESFTLGEAEYEGTLYQQYALGFGGPRLPIAQLYCQVII